MWKAGISLVAMLALVGCVNENGAIPLDRDTWSPNTDARGAPYAGAVPPVPETSAPTQGSSAAQALFQEFCTPFPNNTARISAVEGSGRFGSNQLSALPVPAFEDVLFFVYTDRSSGAQIGFGNRRADQYCVTVDGRPGNDDVFVLGPDT